MGCIYSLKHDLTQNRSRMDSFRRVLSMNHKCDYYIIRELKVHGAMSLNGFFTTIFAINQEAIWDSG